MSHILNTYNLHESRIKVLSVDKVHNLLLDCSIRVSEFEAMDLVVSPSIEWQYYDANIASSGTAAHTEPPNV